MTSTCIYLFVTTVTGRPFWQTPGVSIAIFSALSGWCHRKSQLSAAPRIFRKKGNNLTSNVSRTCAEIYLALHKIIRTTLYQTTNSTWTVCALILVFCHWIMKSKLLPAIALEWGPTWRTQSVTLGEIIPHRFRCGGAMLCNCHRCTQVSLYSACYLHWIKLAAWSYRLG